MSDKSVQPKACKAAAALAALIIFLCAKPQPAAAFFGREKEQEAQKQLNQAAVKTRGLEKNNDALAQQVKELEQKITALTEEKQRLSTDRDNLLAQVQRQQADNKDFEQVRGERDLLQGLLKKASEDERQLRGENADFESRLHDVQQALEQVAQDRGTLTKQLAQAKKKSKETQLTQELNAQKQENGELNRVMNSAQRELAQSQKQEASLEQRIRKLQEDYTSVVAENSKMRGIARTVPEDVSKMAREHERLIKENSDMHYNLGVLFSNNKDYSRAATEFNKVIELRPDDADAYYNLGVIYAEHMPDREKALSIFRKYLTLNPGSKDSSWVKQYIASWRAWEAHDRLE